jgi:hypothetical protein
MNHITVAFYKGQETLSDKLVSWWTNSKYSHVEIIIGDNWITSHPTDGVRKILNEQIYLDCWDFIRIPTHNCNTIDNIVNKYIDEQLGLTYDWIGIIFSQFIKLGIDSNTKWFCSEFVTKILQLYLITEVLDVKPNKVNPGYLYNLLINYK